MLGQMLTDLHKVSRWLDDETSQQYKDQPLAQDWARVSKVIEELGEAIAELISFTGQNPRKPQTADSMPMLVELADVAMTAMLSMLHFTDDPKLTGTILVDKARDIYARMIAHQSSSARGQQGCTSSVHKAGCTCFTGGTQ